VRRILKKKITRWKEIIEDEEKKEILPECQMGKEEKWK